MVLEYLWALDANGYPWKLYANPDPDICECVSWCREPVFDSWGNHVRILKVAACKKCIFAIDGKGHCFVYVYRSYTSIRRIVSTYENQRWYPLLGWSSKTLPTDRASFSNEAGNRAQPFKIFDFPSDGWEWEGPWVIDNEASHYNKEGWQFATNFGRTISFRKSSSLNTFVRRRRWVCCMRYSAVDNWIQMNVSTASGYFTDVCVGGFDVCYESEDRFSLFALNHDGILFHSISSCCDSPASVEWVRLDPILDTRTDHEQCLDITSISCSSSSGILVAVTWDGRLFYRFGVTASCRVGKGWQCLQTPVNLPATSISIGSSSIWVLSSNGKLWATNVKPTQIGKSLDLCKYVSSDSYKPIGDDLGQVYVWNNDLVVGVSRSTNVLFLRFGINGMDFIGRSWIPIVSQADFNGNDPVWLQVDGGGCNLNDRKFPKHWIKLLQNVSKSNGVLFRGSVWRQSILRALYRQNEVVQMYQDNMNFVCHMNEGSWSMMARVEMLHSSLLSLNWVEATIIASISESVQGSIKIVSKRGRKVNADLSQVVGVFSTFDQNRSYTMLIHFENDSLIQLAFGTEEERDQWQLLIQKVVTKIIHSSSKLYTPSFGWVVNNQHQPVVTILSTLSHTENDTIQVTSLCELRWLQQLGSFQKISVGYLGITWGIEQNGKVCTLSCEYDILRDFVDQSATLGYTQSDSVVKVVCENQKQSFFNEFKSFNGKANGRFYAWSDETGLIQREKNEGRLQSKFWKWQDPCWLLVANENNDEGWSYAKKFGMEFTEEKGLVRRRIWQRKMILSLPAPWVNVSAPKISTISVQKDDQYPIYVWALSSEGKLLCRKNCSKKKPAGDSWFEIPLEPRLYCISAYLNRIVWAITSCGDVAACTFSDPCDLESNYLMSVDKPQLIGSIKKIEAGKSVVWLLSDNGQLFRRIGVSSENLIGCRWIAINSSMAILDMSLDKEDRLYAVALRDGKSILVRAETNACDESQHRVTPQISWEIDRKRLDIVSLSVW